MASCDPIQSLGRRLALVTYSREESGDAVRSNQRLVGRRSLRLFPDNLVWHSKTTRQHGQPVRLKSSEEFVANNNNNNNKKKKKKKKGRQME